MRLEVTKELILDQLGRELATKLKLPEPPGLSYRPPSDDEPGVLIVPEELDEAGVREAVAAHVPADPAPQPLDALLGAIQQATSVAALRQALIDHLPTAIEGGRP